MVRDWLKRLVRPLPQWTPIAVAPHAQIVTASLHWAGNFADVTTDHTVASLNPLIIATSVDGGPCPVLEYTDSATGKLLGVLHLLRAESVVIEDTSLTFYRVTAGEHYCLGWPMRSWNAWLQNRSMLRNRSANHLNMAPAAAQQLMIAYLCPRPVVLVSVDVPDHQNIFPMDLIGPLKRSGLFSLALRNTNVSEPVIREVHRVVLSHVPATMKASVYKLSQHHKHPLMDWSALPFSVRPSPTFSTPAVAAALCVQELTIVHSQTIGLHTFFLARVVSDENGKQNAQLHHTAGFHQAYRNRHAMPFTEV